jgi:hypothetical protein
VAGGRRPSQAIAAPLRAALCIVLLGAAPATAARRSVAPDPVGRAEGLAAALAAAAPGDTLVLLPGTYRGSFNLRSGVSLLGAAGPDSTVLDADGERYVLVGRGLDSTTVVAGLTLQNGRRDHPNSGGGGIYLHRSSPVVVGNVFRGHLGYLGPGVYTNYDCAPVIAFNAFHDNEGYLGGAVAAYQDCAPLVYNNVMQRNRAVSGGGILCLKSAAVVLNNTLIDNRAEPGGGGAIYCDKSPALIAANVLVRNVDPRPDGGAVYWLEAEPPAVLRDNLVWDNEGGAEGGACPAYVGRDGNCAEAAAFADTTGGIPARLGRDASCAPQAGAAAWDPRRPPPVPETVLSAWRTWRREHGR